MSGIQLKTSDGSTLNVPASPESPLSMIIAEQGLWQDVALCSGLGKCGLCRVRYLSAAPEPQAEELRKLSADELGTGWRLSCLHPADECEVELPRPARTGRTVKEIAPIKGNFSLAVDLGTTSIHWNASVNENEAMAGTLLNPQTGFGSEVMSRLALAASKSGMQSLRSKVVESLNSVINDLEEKLGGKCSSLAVSGNPAMIYILLGMDVTGLSRAPYTLSYAGGDMREIVPTLPKAYIAPLFAPFVGADLSAGLAALHFSDTEIKYPYMLADLGTNGEFILAVSDTERVCASVPMGPALEGVGLSCGHTAAPGIISGFSQSPAGIAPRKIAGDEKPESPAMTGTGSLSLTALLLKNGVLDEEGLFLSECTPLARKLAQRVDRTGPEPVFTVLPGLNFPASDIEEILKVKAAFNLAMSELLTSSGLEPSDLAAFFIAGAMGEHVSLSDLETLGFLPPQLKEKAVVAGNTSLAGTRILLTNKPARIWLTEVSDSMRTLDLASDPKFGSHYMERMRFSYIF